MAVIKGEYPIHPTPGFMTKTTKARQPSKLSFHRHSANQDEGALKPGSPPTEEQNAA